MKKITTLEQLEKLALERKSVESGQNKAGVYFRLPAAFVIGMPGIKLLNLFRAGLYEYARRTR